MLLYIAPRPALPTTSGQVLMHRHLSLLGPRYRIAGAHCQSADSAGYASDLLPLRSVFTRWRHPQIRRFADGLNAILGFAISRSAISGAICRHRPDAILALAEPPVFHPAVAAARSHRIPVIGIVHDWTPAWLNTFRQLKPVANHVFRQTCRRCDITLSVSPALAARIGPERERHRLLYPIPGEMPATVVPSTHQSRFSAHYAGIFHYFHSEEMAGLCAELNRRGRSDILRLWGPEPHWNDRRMRSVADGHYYAGMLSQSRLPAVLASASALLVICPFSPYLSEFSRYSFPSKLTEYCRFARPILVWAPADSAASAWARTSGAAVLVTDPAPAAIASELLSLENDPRRCAEFGAAAAREAASTFAPTRLQDIFEKALEDAITLGSSSRTSAAPFRSP